MTCKKINQTYMFFMKRLLLVFYLLSFLSGCYIRNNVLESENPSDKTKDKSYSLFFNPYLKCEYCLQEDMLRNNVFTIYQKAFKTKIDTNIYNVDILGKNDTVMLIYTQKNKGWHIAHSLVENVKKEKYLSAYEMDTNSVLNEITYYMRIDTQYSVMTHMKRVNTIKSGNSENVTLNDCMISRILLSKKECKLIDWRCGK